MQVYLKGTGKFNKKGWFDCSIVKSNSRTKRVFVPEINTEIKVRNYKIREDVVSTPYIDSANISVEIKLKWYQKLWKLIKKILKIN